MGGWLMFSCLPLRRGFLGCYFSTLRLRHIHKYPPNHSRHLPLQIQGSLCEIIVFIIVTLFFVFLLYFPIPHNHDAVVHIHLFLPELHFFKIGF